jgi:hypothetical protein
MNAKLLQLHGEKRRNKRPKRSEVLEADRSMRRGDARLSLAGSMEPLLLRSATREGSFGLDYITNLPSATSDVGSYETRPLFVALSVEFWSWWHTRRAGKGWRHNKLLDREDSITENTSHEFKYLLRRLKVISNVPFHMLDYLCELLLKDL